VHSEPIDQRSDVAGDDRDVLVERSGEMGHDRLGASPSVQEGEHRPADGVERQQFLRCGVVHHSAVGGEHRGDGGVWTQRLMIGGARGAVAEEAGRRGHRVAGATCQVCHEVEHRVDVVVFDASSVRVRRERREGQQSGTVGAELVL
jgi:hypothetical protein